MCVNVCKQGIIFVQIVFVFLISIFPLNKHMKMGSSELLITHDKWVHVTVNNFIIVKIDNGAFFLGKMKSPIFFYHILISTLKWEFSQNMV